jgi:hypothetical protein
VAHACNPNYSEGRHQEDHGSKPAQANGSQDPISKTLHKDRAGGVVQGEGPEFKLYYHHKKKRVTKEFVVGGAGWKCPGFVFTPHSSLKEKEEKVLQCISQQVTFSVHGYKAQCRLFPMVLSCRITWH